MRAEKLHDMTNMTIRTIRVKRIDLRRTHINEGRAVEKRTKPNTVTS